MSTRRNSENAAFEEYNEALLEPSEMQELQDRFCAAQHVYAACFSRSQGVITKPYGKKEELAFLYGHISMDTYMSLLHRLVSSPYENVMEAETGEQWLRCCGLAVRVKGAIVCMWVIMAVLEGEETTSAIPEQIEVTTPEDYDRSLEFLETISKQFLTARMDEIFAEEAQRRAANEREAFKKELQRNEAVTSIVLMQGSENSFPKVVNDILEQTVRYLNLGNASLWRLSKDCLTVDIICEFSGEDHISYMRKVQNLPTDRVPFLTGKPYMISSDSMKPEEFERLFRKYNIKAAVSLPVEVNEKVGMYLTFTENRVERTWDVNDIKFLNDVRQIIQSILERRIARNSLASSYASLEAVLENTGCGIYVEEPRSERIVFVNRTFKELCPNSGKSRSIRELFSGEGGDLIPSEEAQEIFSPLEGRWYEVRITPLTWVDGTVVRLYTLTDIHEKKEKIADLERKLQTDELTGLYNRNRFERDMERALTLAKETGSDGALILFDLDDFKQVNEGVGRSLGDVLLQQIAEELKKLAGAENCCYRLEGDSFALVLNHHQVYLLEDMVEELRALFLRPWYLNGEDTYCNISVSILKFPEDGTTLSELLRKGDLGMNDAKRDGKNRVVRYNDTIDLTEITRSEMEQNLTEAVNRGCAEFEVYYQPVISLKDGKEVCRGAEALLRWNSEKLGLVAPRDFIPMAEYLNLMQIIGTHVLKEACRTLRYWNDYGHPEYTINVNLSVIQLLQKNITEIISRILQETRIRPEALILDVAESLTEHDLNRMKRIFSDLRKIGVLVALDDFGIGASCMNHIRELPIDQIKIDPSFIRDIASDPFSSTFVRMVSELAHTIGIETVVEGVETKEQLKELKTTGAEYIQGYYFGRPVTKKEFEDKYL